MQDGPHIVYSCVVDGDGRFFLQGQHLVRSLLAVGVRPSDILVNFPDRALEYRPFFDAMGVMTAQIVPFADQKYCNKVVQLRNVPKEADLVVCCDTDLLFLSNISDDLAARPDRFLGKIVDYANPPVETLRALQSHYPDLAAIPETLTDIDREPTLEGNFNGGFYCIPGAWLPAFSDAWEHYAQTLYENLKVRRTLGKYSWHIDQISFCFALHALNAPYEALPIEFNYPLHFEVNEAFERAPDKIKVLHYHNVMNEQGLPEPKFVRSAALTRRIQTASDTMLSVWAGQTAQARRDHAPFTFVAGFHRSGTSLLCAGCEFLGYSLGTGELLDAQPDNPKGYYENRSLVKMNESLHAALQSDWDDIFFSFGDRRDEICAAFAPRIRAFLDDEFPTWIKRDYILKDPRIMQTYGVWRHAIRAMDHPDPKLIYVLRNPLESALSQRRRHEALWKEENNPFHFFGADLRETLLLWYSYTVRFLATLDHEDVLLVRYGDLVETPGDTLTRIADWAGMQTDKARLEAFCTSFLDPGLRHHQQTDEALREETARFPQIHALYQELDALGRAQSVSAAGLRQLADRHMDLFADILQFDFLGRLYPVPKKEWIKIRARQHG